MVFIGRTKLRLNWEKIELNLTDENKRNRHMRGLSTQSKKKKHQKFMFDVNQIIGIINTTPQHSCIEHIGIASAILSIVLCCMRTTGIVFTVYTHTNATCLKAFNLKQIRLCVRVHMCVYASISLSRCACVCVCVIVSCSFCVLVGNRLLCKRYTRFSVHFREENSEAKVVRVCTRDS